MWRNVGYAENKLYTSEDQYELCDIITYFSSCANMNIYGMKLRISTITYKKERKKKKSYCDVLLQQQGLQQLV